MVFTLRPHEPNKWCRADPQAGSYTTPQDPACAAPGYPALGDRALELCAASGWPHVPGPGLWDPTSPPPSAACGNWSLRNLCHFCPAPQAGIGSCTVLCSESSVQAMITGCGEPCRPDDKALGVVSGLQAVSWAPRAKIHSIITGAG